MSILPYCHDSKERDSGREEKKTLLAETLKKMFNCIGKHCFIIIENTN